MSSKSAATVAADLRMLEIREPGHAQTAEIKVRAWAHSLVKYSREESEISRERFIADYKEMILSLKGLSGPPVLSESVEEKVMALQPESVWVIARIIQESLGQKIESPDSAVIQAARQLLDSFYAGKDSTRCSKSTAQAAESLNTVLKVIGA
jgi:hypothetical protein